MIAGWSTLLLYKLGAGGCLAIAVFLAVLASLVDAEGPVRRAWTRYVAFLERKLRSMFLSTSGNQIALGQVAAIIALTVLYLTFDIPYGYILPALAAVGPTIYLERKRRERVTRLEKQVDTFILALANALKSIPSVTAAFQSVADTSSSPIREEIELCNREMRVGSTLDEALLHMGTRVGSEQLDSALSTVVLGRQIGGNLPRVLESTAASMREMARLEGVVDTKTAEAKMQLRVLGAAPFVLAVSLALLSPGYFDPLQESATGYLVGIAAVGSWLLALVLARKVLSVNI
jgi:tight adherence protein B